MLILYNINYFGGSMKKNKNLEMKIYELLGVKIFRKMAFTLAYIISLPKKRKMTKEEWENYNNKTSNYNIGKVKDLDDVKKYKKQMYLNASIHTFGLFLCIVDLLLGGLDAFFIIMTLINVYCIMLQRYNIIRLNKVIKKFYPKYEHQKEEIKKELIENDKLLKEHTYKIVKENKKEVTEKEITFEELLNNSSLSELKAYRESLKYFKCAETIDENRTEYDFPISKTTSLRLEKK